MDNCTHDCSSCSANCSSRQSTEIPKEPLNQHSSVKKVIGVISGKGGVGKSLVTSMLAVLMNRKGYSTAIMDADITGPSIPNIFGLKEQAMASSTEIYPVESKTGIKVMSINLLTKDPTDPVVWRGPVIGGAVKQFWTDVLWEDVDFMFVDMPPGTGDVALTVFQSIPVDYIIVVTSPQDLVSMIVTKAIKMANMMNVPILGIVENYSYVECPDCNKKIKLFGESKIEEIAAKEGLRVLAQLPIDPAVASYCDKGTLELMDKDWLLGAADLIEQTL